MKFRVRYRRIRVTVQGERPVQCAACPRHLHKGWKIELHHYAYMYTTAEVRKNPQLALENTVPFCYHCHKLADAIKNLMKDPFKFHRVMAALEYAAINRKKEELNV